MTLSIDSILITIGFFWLIRTVKAVLFWIYLWQLKEYHIGRFLDHFRTHKGKRLFFSYLFIIKLLLLVLIFINFPAALYILLIVYLAEAILPLAKGLKLPKWTIKTAFLCFISVITVVGFLIVVKNPLWLLAFDILAPLAVSVIVLAFQPFFVMARNRILGKARQKMAEFKNIKVIAITGSFGKTSTKEFLTTILLSKFNVLSTPEHKNSEMGIAQTILKDLNEKHQIFIVEMGAYSKGGIKLLCNMVKPSIGMVTGVNEQHLATFGSMENLLSAEGGQELLYSLPQDGLLVVNGDNKYCMDLYKEAKIDKRVYSLKNDKVDSDIFADEVTVGENCLDFLAITKKGETSHFNVNILGKQNIQNLLGAILVSKEMGMNLDDIARAAKSILQSQAGIKLLNGLHGIKIIDSSYSSNPDGVMADLDYLNTFKGKKVVVMPCLIELGKKSQEIHYQIGKKIAKVCDMAIITTQDKFENLKKGAVQEGMPEDKIIFSEKSKGIFHTITTFCKQGDAVLLEGRVPSELVKLLEKK